jgi:mannose-1-phosphate guanylyltransferase/phosphomannomutase
MTPAAPPPAPRTIALLQAGGRGARMQQSGVAQLKPLVPIRGVPLLERNVMALLSAGLREIVVVVPAGAPELARFVDTRCVALARVFGAALERIDELEPRGTLGGADALASRADVVLVVNTDNLTALDLSAVLADHAASRAAMTLAVHVEPFRLPYGVIDVEGDRVTAYREKPTIESLVCSAITVLDAETLRRIPRGGRCGLPDLVQAVVGAGGLVHAHRHAAPWVDVNDARDAERAEELLARHASAFELLSSKPTTEVAGAVLRCDGALLLERRPATAFHHAGLWDTPGGKLEPAESPAAAIARELEEELGLKDARARPVGVFDDVDLSRSAVLRHHVFELEVARDAVRPRDGEFRWIAAAEVERLEPMNPVVLRSLAAARHPASPG